MSMSKTSVALNNLRGVVILIVIAFHSALAYLRFLGPDPFPFDSPPYQWRAFAIVDSRRWLGFDVFCAWQDVYLMSLMFFLSALFAWPSLTRKGTGKFLGDRAQRLGVPYLLAVVVVMPLALYPTYRMTATDPGLAAYARHYLALPFWPAGPMWFLWLLLAFTLVAVALHRFAPQLIALLGQRASSAAAHPGRYFIGLATAAALAYVPLALAFTSIDWSEHGLFSFQLSRPLHYAVYYFAGFGVGVHGLERGLLAPDGLLARRWARWLAAALASLLLWMALTGLAMNYPVAPPLELQVAVAVSFEIACASGCFFVVAACLRFATVPSRLLGSVAARAYGMYVFHYIFVVWLQYALIGVAMLAIAKGLLVFGATVLLAWATTAAMRFAPYASRLLGPAPAAPAPRRSPMLETTVDAGVGHFIRRTRRAHRLDPARSSTPCP